MTNSPGPGEYKGLKPPIPNSQGCPGFPLPQWTNLGRPVCSPYPKDFPLEICWGKWDLDQGGYVNPAPARQDAERGPESISNQWIVDAHVGWQVEYSTDRTSFLVELAMDSTVTKGGRRRVNVLFTVKEGHKVVVVQRRITGAQIPASVLRS